MSLVLELLCQLSTVGDARDLLISSVLSPDPVMFIDDRWLYDREEDLKEIEEIDLAAQGPIKRLNGTDITLVGAGYSSYLCEQAATELKTKGISAEVVDLRVINPIDPSVIVESVKKTGNLLVVDGGWTNCGLAGEIIALVCERLSLGSLKSSPQRITLLIVLHQRVKPWRLPIIQIAPQSLMARLLNSVAEKNISIHPLILGKKY